MYTEKDNKTVDVLGTEYNILFVPDEELAEIGVDGTTDHSVKLIKVAVFTPQKDSVTDLYKYQRHVLRHEIIHAFLYESGLGCNSCSVESWATNEEMIDWIAYQHNKLHAAFEKAGAL